MSTCTIQSLSEVFLINQLVAFHFCAQMVPISIAEQLKSGGQVEPGYFHSATICYIDVTDFMTTSSSTDNKVTYRDFKVNYKFYSLRFSILKTVKNRD